jgi:hypothetical protein
MTSSTFQIPYPEAHFPKNPALPSEQAPSYSPDKAKGRHRRVRSYYAHDLQTIIQNSHKSS